MSKVLTETHTIFITIVTLYRLRQAPLPDERYGNHNTSCQPLQPAMPLHQWIRKDQQMTNPENPPVPPPGYYPPPPLPQNTAPPWTTTPPQNTAPSGSQQYWDGQNWQNPAPFPQQPPISRDNIRTAMTENRSIWVTNAMAAYSLMIGLFSLCALFACGAGAGTAILGGIVGYLAFNKSKTTGAGRGMAIAGMATNGAAFAIGCIVVMFLFLFAGAGAVAP